MFANLKRIHKRTGANAFKRFSKVLAAASLVGTASFVASAQAGVNNPLMGISNGETLTYSVRWGLIPSVGRIKITADTSGSGNPAVLRVSTTTWTWGIARGIFPFDARGESLYDLKTGRLLSSNESSSYRNKEVKNALTFNYADMTAHYSDDVHPEKSHSIRMPLGAPSDLILALIQTRYWNLSPGQSRDTLVIFQDQFYPLTIRAEPDPEYVLTSLGLFKTVVLVPRMEKTAPVGMFKHGSTVRVWIEKDDPRHLPVRFEVGFKVGTGTATILDYQAPK